MAKQQNQIQQIIEKYKSKTPRRTSREGNDSVIDVIVEKEQTEETYEDKHQNS